MINPTIDDIGRGVVFYDKHGDELLPAYGTLISFDDNFVVVQYGDSEPMLTLRDELIWTEPEMTKIAPVADEPERYDDPDQKKLFSDLPTR